MKKPKAAKEEASYFKHKAACHEALNQVRWKLALRVLLEDAGKEEASKKKRYKAIKMAKVPNEKKNVRRLCAIAGIVAKCSLPQPKGKA